MLYGVEAEQCLDSGRPTSIQEADAKAPFPRDPPVCDIMCSLAAFAIRGANDDTRIFLPASVGSPSSLSWQNLAPSCEKLST